MKHVAAITFFLLMISVAAAQMPVPDLNQAPNAPSASEQRVSRSIHRTSFFSPTVSYSGYTIGADRFFGMSLMLQYSMFHSRSESIDLLGGAMFRFRNVSESVNIEDYAPLGIRGYSEMHSSPSMMRGMRFGIGMLGMDYTIYLADGDVRPYVGLGAMFLAYPYRGAVAGTLAPDVKAGLFVDLPSGFSGFAELKHMFGLPVSIGSPYARFERLTGFALGIAFAPRFN